MNLSRIAGTVGLELIGRLYSNATLSLYTGSIPASPESATTGTQLVVWTFQNGTGPAGAGTPFTAPVSGASAVTATANFVASSVAPIASGTAGYGRAVMGSPAAWATSTAYPYGAIRAANANTYLCVGSGTSAATGGGPSTTGEAIYDGTVTWLYVTATSANVIADYTVGTSATDIVLGTTTITTGTNVNFSSFTQSIPTV